MANKLSTIASSPAVSRAAHAHRESCGLEQLPRGSARVLHAAIGALLLFSSGVKRRA